MKTAVARPISCESRADRDFVVMPASAMLKKHWKGTAWVAITVAVWAIVVGNYLGGALLGAVGLLVLTLLSREPIPPPDTLFAAIGTRDVDTARFLLDAKADPNARVAKGPSPLEDAVRRRVTAIVDLLLEHGARPYATADGQDSALALAASSAMLLVTAGADPMAANPGRLGGTPLSLAVGGSYTNLCRLFLERDAINADAPDPLLETAARNDAQDIMALLVAARARPQAGAGMAETRAEDVKVVKPRDRTG